MSLADIMKGREHDVSGEDRDDGGKWTAGAGGGGGEPTSYAGQHRPMKQDGGAAPLHDLDTAIPDIYSKDAMQYYGTGDDALDRNTLRVLQSVRGNPDAMVTAYRALPKGVKAEINPNDWVTINRDYAKMHGESALNGEYTIASKKVKARHLFGNADSIHEQGYFPSDDAFKGTDGGGYKHGAPTAFPYMRNTEKAPKNTGGFGQDIEPHGRYLSERTNMQEDDAWFKERNYETGTAHFKSPIVMPFGGEYGHATNWKSVLAAHYGKTGKALSAAIVKDGFDGIITHDKYGTSETVDLSPFVKKPVAKAADEARDADGKWTAGGGGAGAAHAGFEAMSAREVARFTRQGDTKGAPIPNVPPNRAKNLAALRDKILDHGGHAVYISQDPKDPDNTMILRDGAYHSGASAVQITGQFGHNNCHQNSAIAHLDDPEKNKLFTGYAADESGLWVRHSWIERDGVIQETTTPRAKYFGVAMTPAQTELYLALRNAGGGTSYLKGAAQLPHPIAGKVYQAEMAARGKGPGTPLADLPKPEDAPTEKALTLADIMKGHEHDVSGETRDEGGKWTTGGAGGGKHLPDGAKISSPCDGTYVATIGEPVKTKFGVTPPKEIARVNLSDDKSYVTSVTVDPAYRRKGVASALYDHIESELGSKLKPSPTHRTPEGNKLWESRTGASAAGNGPAGDGFAAGSEDVKPDDPGGVEIRPDGWKAGNDAVGEMTRPGHLYRGMTSDEFEAHKKAGFIQSSGAYSDKSEGTCFDDNAPSAEGYANYGRDDPRVTGKPTYMIEIKHDPEQTPQDKRDYYYKAPKPIGLDKVTRAWKMHARGGAVVAHKIHDAEPETEKALTLADIMKGHVHDVSGEPRDEGGKWTSPGGDWQTSYPADKGAVSLVPLAHLKRIAGNDTGEDSSEARIKSIMDSVSKEGLREPVEVSVDPDHADGPAQAVSEGNHRVEALRRLGYTHAPAFGQRASLSNNDTQPLSLPDGVKAEDVGSTGFFSPASVGVPSDSDGVAIARHETEKALTLADIMKVRDAVGHEHGADGRFGNTGGGAKAATASKTGIPEGVTVKLGKGPRGGVVYNFNVKGSASGTAIVTNGVLTWINPARDMDAHAIKAAIERETGEPLGWGAHEPVPEKPKVAEPPPKTGLEDKDEATVAAAGKYPRIHVGDVVDGREVGETIANFESIGASLDNYELVPGIREVPMSAFGDVSRPPSFYSKSEKERTEALAAAIADSKQLDPMIVVQAHDGPYVLEGSHRFNALRLLGATSFPAKVVVDLDEPDETEKALTLADIMKVVDDDGNKHGDDGRFTSGGGGAKADKPPRIVARYDLRTDEEKKGEGNDSTEPRECDRCGKLHHVVYEVEPGGLVGSGCAQKLLAGHGMDMATSKKMVSDADRAHKAKLAAPKHLKNIDREIAHREEHLDEISAPDYLTPDYSRRGTTPRRPASKEDIALARESLAGQKHMRRLWEVYRDAPLDVIAGFDPKLTRFATDYSGGVQNEYHDLWKPAHEAMAWKPEEKDTEKMATPLSRVHAAATRALAKSFAQVRPGDAIHVAPHIAAGMAMPTDAGRALRTDTSLLGGHVVTYHSAGSGAVASVSAEHVSHVQEPEGTDEGNGHVRIVPLTVGDPEGSAVVVCPKCGVTGTIEPQKDNAGLHTVKGALGHGDRIFSDRASATEAVRNHYAAAPTMRKVRDEVGHDHGNDGRFVSQGGGGAAAGDDDDEPEPAAAPAAAGPSVKRTTDDDGVVHLDVGDSGDASVQRVDQSLYCKFKAYYASNESALHDVFSALSKEAKKKQGAVRLNIDGFTNKRELDAAITIFGKPTRCNDTAYGDDGMGRLENGWATEFQFEAPASTAKPKSDKPKRNDREMSRARAPMNPIEYSPIARFFGETIPPVTYGGHDTWTPAADGLHRWDSDEALASVPADRLKDYITLLQSNVGYSVSLTEGTLNNSDATPQSRGAARAQSPNMYYESARLQKIKNLADDDARRDYIRKTRHIAARIAEIKPKTVAEAVKKLGSVHNAAFDRVVAREAMMFIHNTNLIDEGEDAFPLWGGAGRLGAQEGYTGVHGLSMAEIEHVDKTLTDTFGPMTRSGMGTTLSFHHMKEGTPYGGFAFPQTGLVTVGVGLWNKGSFNGHDWSDRTLIHEYCHAMSRSSLGKEMKAFNKWMRAKVKGTTTEPNVKIVHNADGTGHAMRSIRAFITDHAYNSKDFERPAPGDNYDTLQGDYQEDWAIGLSEIVLDNAGSVTDETGYPTKWGEFNRGLAQVRKETAAKLAELFGVKRTATDPLLHDASGATVAMPTTSAYTA
jgi:hypothetical protein